MSIIPVAICVVLMATALLHAAWGFGLTWPGTDQQSLVRHVVGAPNISRLPPLPITLTVAFGMAAAGLFALWGAHLVDLALPQWMRKTSIIVLAVIFLVRGMITYIPKSPFRNSVEPFHSLNHNYFSPLILALGTGYVYILFFYE